MPTSLPSCTYSVIVFCAQWCSSCREFQPVLNKIAHDYPNMHFFWLDIEDEADAIDEIEIEIDDFPTLAIFRGEEVLYFGASIPNENVIRPLLRAATNSHQALSTSPARLPALLTYLIHRK